MSRLYTLLVLLFLAPARLWAVEASPSSDSLSSGTARRVPLLTIAPPHERYYNVTMRTRALGIGGILLGEEYLSPLNYGGTYLSFVSQSVHLGYKQSGEELLPPGASVPLRPRTADHDWLHHTLFTLGYGNSTNPAGNASIYSLDLTYSRSLLRRLGSGRVGSLALGAGLGGYVSGLYSTRNGNNPGTIHASLGLDLALLYSYRFGSEHFPVLVKAFAGLQLAGGAFAQEFGESYYELYYYTKPKNRLTFVHPFNNLTGQLYASIELPLLDYGILSLGYRLGAENRHLKRLHSYQTTQSLAIGFTTTHLPLGGRRVTKATHPSLPL